MFRRLYENSDLKALIFGYDPTYRNHFTNAVLPNIPAHLRRQCYHQGTDHCFRRCHVKLRLMAQNNVTLVECNFTTCLNHIYEGIQCVISDIFMNISILSISEITQVLKECVDCMLRLKITENNTFYSLVYIEDTVVPTLKKLQFVLYFHQEVCTVRLNSFELIYTDESFGSIRTFFPLEDNVERNPGWENTVYPVMLS
jgi:hypothetical protein